MASAVSAMAGWSGAARDRPSAERPISGLPVKWPPMPPSDEILVHARGLTKRFDAFTAVNAVDFDVRTTEAFGFLGPNGAGKTSTMRMIACSSPVTEGELSVIGMDPRTQAPQIKARLGVVPQTDNLDAELSVQENLLMYARYFDMPMSEARPRAAELLEFMQLSERAADQVEPLSGGMKRRLTIARALINDPELIILDEPTTGLDPQARHLLWERLYRLKQRGATLIITTHYMDEAEQLCDRLVIMDKADIVAAGTPRELIERYATREVLELRIPDGARSSLDGRLDGLAERVEELPDRYLLYSDDGEHALETVHAREIPIDSALVRRATLEDVFLRLTGRSLVE
jgi:lipooligosaccharide transport system ATP-binding protein